MKKEVNHAIRKRFNDIIYNIARYTEILLSVVILVVIAFAGIRLIYDVAGTSIMNMDSGFFSEFLSKMCIRDRLWRMQLQIPLHGTMRRDWQRKRK